VGLRPANSASAHQRAAYTGRAADRESEQAAMQRRLAAKDAQAAVESCPRQNDLKPYLLVRHPRRRCGCSLLKPRSSSGLLVLLVIHPDGHVGHAP
jgi:hypothetical protein